jgi:translation initiation factor eIF-2B subunit delta
MKDYTEEIKQLIAPIAQDNYSGSSELSRRTSVALLDLLNDLKEPNSASAALLKPPLIEFAKRLIEAQPKMATLFNLANRALLIVNDRLTFGEAKEAIEKFVYNYLAVVMGGSDNIAQHTFSLISDNSIILVHSYSGTVTRALLASKRQGKSFEVFCTESRPIMEGRRTATVLSAAGIPVTFLLDSAACFAIERSNLVLCGADAVTIDGVINKVGTTLISLAAHWAGKPIYALTDTTKFLPPVRRMPAEEMHSASEIWPDAPARLSIFNLYFESTPLEYFSGLVTEHGILSRSEVESRITNLEVSAELCEE